MRLNDSHSRLFLSHIMSGTVTCSFLANMVFSSRTYILEENCSKTVWLVDCGDFDKILDRIGDKAIAGVLLTHAHFDHIYGLPELLSLFPQCLIVTNETGLAALGSDKANMSRYNGTPMAVTPGNVVLVHEGDRVPIFDGIMARVFETPGHNPSCLTFEIGDLLFTGDAYIPGEKVITALPGGSKSIAAASVARILELGNGKVILPGHEIRVENQE